MEQIRVRPVEGRMILDPRTIGSEHRRLGYRRIVEEPRFENGVLVAGKMVQGKPTESVRWEWESADPVVVTETEDGYFRAHILNGDLDYDSHVDGDKTRREPTLVRATALNVKARAKAAELATKHAVEAAAHERAALEAAEQGLTVDELHAQTAAAAKEAASADARDASASKPTESA